jgi:putative ABC transport system permease protein
MTQELRYALRVLLKSPTFTIVAIATLALGIGANTAVLSLVNGLLIKPLPYHAPQKLVLLFEQFKAQGLDRIPVSPPEFLDYKRQTTCFDGLAVFDYGGFNLTGGDVPERVAGSLVSPNVFQLLGVEPIKGRVFAESEGESGRDNVIVISARLWQRRFNSDPQLVGKQLSVNGRSFTVVGIMPAKFEFPLPLFNLGAGQFGDQVDLWKPVAFTPEEMKNRGSRSYGVMGRLRDGVTVPQAQAQLDAAVRIFKKQYPNNYDSGDSFGATIYPLHEQVIGGMRSALWILLGAVGLVLLIACANLTTMLLARAGTREREMAIRVALGAGRFRLLRQLLTESVLLSLLGGFAGIVLAIWGLDLLRALGAQTIPRLQEVTLDRTVLLLTFAVSVATGIIFGLVPALVSTEPGLTEALKEGGRGSSEGRRRNRLRNGLVIAEMTLAFLLLIAAGLLLKSFVRLQNVDPGFNPHQVLTMDLWLPDTKYPRGKPVSNFLSEVRRRVAVLPGVQNAALVDILPLSGSKSDSSFAIEGRASDVTPDEQIRTVSPDYFRVLQTPLLRGRFFTDADTADAPPVAIINQTLAKRYWPNENAVGKRITFDDPKKNPKWVTVVGIVGNIRDSSLDEPAPPEYYLPHQQYPYRFMTLAVRSPQDPRALAAAIRGEVLALDPDEPISKIRTLDAVVADSVAPRRLAVVMVGVFAGIALLLATVGIYGVMAFLVAQRTHEIGVRMALGAQAKNILNLVLGHALKLVSIGVAAGLIAALLTTRVLQSLLYSVGAFDVATFLTALFVLAPAALLASYIPARRATRADPMIALGRG